MSPERTTDVFFALAAAGAWMAIAAAWVIDHAVAIGAAGLAVGGVWIALWRANRTAQRILADSQPGTDTRLYLDAVAAYGDCEDLDRLRHAINQHRREGEL